MSEKMFRLISVTGAFCLALLIAIVADIEIHKILALVGFIAGFDAWVSGVITRIVVGSMLPIPVESNNDRKAE